MGLLLLGFVAVGVLRVGQRLKPAPFMLASSIFLALLSLVLIGKGVRALQESGVLSIHALSWPELPALGVFGTTEGMVGQGELLLLLVWSAIWSWLHARKAVSPQPLTGR